MEDGAFALVTISLKLKLDAAPVETMAKEVGDVLRRHRFAVVGERARTILIC